uniref:Uncharacterized protein n=1 Tax=Timema tahoe TaxID=61484 RepID=A0A7R9IN76_9NEOP|nr:unnamed protein product [Timema tahoe]
MSWIPECSPKVLLLAAGALFIGFLILVVSLKIFVHLTKGVCRSIANMDGKTVIVTGANSGAVGVQNNAYVRQRKTGKLWEGASQAARTSGSNEDAQWQNEEEVEKPRLE